MALSTLDEELSLDSLQIQIDDWDATGLDLPAGLVHIGKLRPVFFTFLKNNSMVLEFLVCRSFQ